MFLLATTDNDSGASVNIPSREPRLYPPQNAILPFGASDGAPKGEFPVVVNVPTSPGTALLLSATRVSVQPCPNAVETATFHNNTTESTRDDIREVYISDSQIPKKSSFVQETQVLKRLGHGGFGGRARHIVVIVASEPPKLDHFVRNGFEFGGAEPKL